MEIRRSTFDDWLAGVADLTQPRYELMKQRVLVSQVKHTDDAVDRHGDRQQRPVRFWAYLGDGEHPYRVCDFTETRQRAGPSDS